MKKLFFTALVAEVAIGGAYVGNTTSDTLVILAKPAGSTGPCNTTVVPCNTVSGPACVVNSIGNPTKSFQVIDKYIYTLSDHFITRYDVGLPN